MDSALRPYAEEVIASCPRFRILLVGKSGAGKSSLVNQIFGVDLAEVSHYTPGRSKIEREIFSPTNERFVLHDSQGFEAGSTSHFDMVKAFIEKRQREPELKDRLHAIWLCVEIPTAGGRTFETGDEALLKLNLLHVPVIVVFTKFDILVSREEDRIAEEDVDCLLTDEELNEQARLAAQKALEETCVRQLDNMRNKHIRAYATVSTKQSYQPTIAKLVEITQNHLSEAVWLIWAFAQRANADVKVNASIEVGRKKYWRGIATTFGRPFLGQRATMRKWLDIIHAEIITVWNFNDPDGLLVSAEFKKLMIDRFLQDLFDESPGKGAASNTTPLKIAGVVATVAGSAATPAAVIVVPIVACAALAAFIIEVIRESPNTVRVLMGYIVDLTIGMQSLFWILQARCNTAPVKRGIIRLAFDGYWKTKTMANVHREINEFIRDSDLFRAAQKDRVLEKVITLIEKHRFHPDAVFKSAAVAATEDDSWGVDDAEAL